MLRISYCALGNPADRSANARQSPEAQAQYDAPLPAWGAAVSSQAANNFLASNLRQTVTLTLSGKSRSYLVDSPSRRRHDPDSDEWTSVDNRFTIDKHLVLTVVSSDRFYFDAEFTSEPRRHTDGMNA